MVVVGGVVGLYQVFMVVVGGGWVVLSLTSAVWLLWEVVGLY